MSRLGINLRGDMSQKNSENKLFIKPDTDLSNLQDKLLFYPFAERDWDVPILLFRDYLSEFWFVDSDYSFTDLDSGYFSSDIFSPMKLIDSSFVGVRESRKKEIRKTENGETFKYLYPGMMTRTYQYKDKEIKINFRRGYDYTSLFGPSELDIAELRLGVFFLRGTSNEGGSNHPWFHSQPVKMLNGEERISLPRKLVKALPDGGLIVTDGSLSESVFRDNNYPNEFCPLSQFHCKDIPIDEALNQAKPFHDLEENLFTCIGCSGRRYGPTLIWQKKKTKSNK